MNKRQTEIAGILIDDEKRVLKEIEKQYEKALSDIDDMIARMIGRDDANLINVIYRIEHQKALRAQVAGVLNQLHSKEFETISEFLSATYTTAFVGSAYDMFGQGVPLIMPIDPKNIVQAVVTDSKLSEDLYTTLGIDVAKMKKSISAEISRGIASGMSYSQIARNISEYTKAPLSRTRTVVRTEAHRIQQASRYDSQTYAKSKGADVLKQWDATLDGNTRDTHRQLDGQLKEIDEPFELGTKKAMYPGDFGDPAEDCNCRCQLLQRARWELDEEELKTLQERAEFFGLDKTENFEEFKKKYLNSIENMPESGIIELDNAAGKVVNSRYCTEKEYNEIVKSHAKSLSKEEKEQISFHVKEDGSNGGYVASRNYSVINSQMRGDGFTNKALDDDDRRTIAAMRRAISKNTLGNDFTLTRYVNADYLSNVFGIMDDSGLLLGNSDILWDKKGKTKDRILNEVRKKLGTTNIEYAFVSTSMIPSKNVVSNGKAVRLTLKAEANTHCYVPKNKKESECILGDGTEYRFDDAFFTIDGVLEIVVTII